MLLSDGHFSVEMTSGIEMEEKIATDFISSDEIKPAPTNTGPPRGHLMTESLPRP